MKLALIGNTKQSALSINARAGPSEKEVEENAIVPKGYGLTNESDWMDRLRLAFAVTTSVEYGNLILQLHSLPSNYVNNDRVARHLPEAPH